MKIRTILFSIFSSILLIILSLFGVFLSMFLGYLFLEWMGISSADYWRPINFFAMLIANFLPIFGVVWVLGRLFERRSLASYGMQINRQTIPRYLRGLLVGFGMFGACVALMALFGMVTVERPFRLASVDGALLILGGFLVQGAAEEVLFRGLFLRFFEKRTGVIFAVIFPSILFALFHGANNYIAPLALLNLFLFGVFASCYTLWENSLWGIFAIHSIWNWVQGSLYGFEVSGMPIAGEGMIFDLAETGADLWTGGKFGIEGGLFCTLILVIGTGVILSFMQYTRTRRE